MDFYVHSEHADEYIPNVVWNSVEQGGKNNNRQKP